MQKIYLPVYEGFNVNEYVVAEGPLIFNVKLFSYIRDFLVNCCVAWGGKDAVVYIDNEDEFVSIEHAVIHPGILYSNLMMYWLYTIDLFL